MSFAEKLHQRIARCGPMPIADYMAAAARHYYATHEPFGLEGDFTTAPEISQMFGEMIGLWCAQTWQDCGGPPTILAELGPGRGTLMADLLRAGQVMPGFGEAQTICFIEQSARLRAAQKKPCRKRGQWINFQICRPDFYC